jgi:hypothetical protein
MKMNRMKEETMNSWKFRFLGLVITTLFVTSLMASPHRVAKNPVEITITKSESEVIRHDDLRAEKVGEVLRKDNSALRINDREGYVIQTEGRPDCPDGTVDDCSGDGDCCPESWIGDGFADCEDQAYGCD